MKLLLDQNVSARLVERLQDLFPGTTHVRDVGLHRAGDEEIWTYALQRGYTIVSKDGDFQQRSFLLGHPPKVIWIRMGNCSTAEIESTLRAHHRSIDTFEGDEDASLLVLS